MSHSVSAPYLIEFRASLKTASSFRKTPAAIALAAPHWPQLPPPYMRFCGKITVRIKLLQVLISACDHGAPVYRINSAAVMNLNPCRPAARRTSEPVILVQVLDQPSRS